MDGDEDLVREISLAFLKDMPHKCEVLRDLLKTRELQAITRQAHSIKGAAANAGAVSMHNIAIALEDAGQRADWEQITKLAFNLQQEFARFKDIVKSG